MKEEHLTLTARSRFLNTGLEQQQQKQQQQQQQHQKQQHHAVFLICYFNYIFLLLFKSHGCYGNYSIPQTANWIDIINGGKSGPEVRFPV